MVLVPIFASAGKIGRPSLNMPSKTGQISGFTCNIGASSGLVGPESFLPRPPQPPRTLTRTGFTAPGRPHSPRMVFHVQLRSVPAGRPRFRGRLTLEGSGQKCRSVASCFGKVPAEASCRQPVRNDTGQHSRQHQVSAARRKSDPRPGVTQPTVGSIPAKPSVRPAEDVASAPQACAAGTEATRVDTREARSGPVRGIVDGPGRPRGNLAADRRGGPR
jgi:hypothetical protein